jgi:ubiquinone/menaquinone biosynthesis C-methylase UbiE
MMSFVHETLYGLFRDPYKALRAAGLQSGQQVLEVGCGPGFFTIPAAKIVGETGNITAIDINPLAVKHVQTKIKAQAVINAKIVLADAAHTHLPDQGFDLVFVFGFVRPVGGMERIWPELYRLLMPAGILSPEGRLQPPREFFQKVRHQGRISQFRKIETTYQYSNGL